MFSTSVQLPSRGKNNTICLQKCEKEERVEGRMRHSTDTAVKHIKHWKNERMKKQTHRVAVYHSYCTHITFTGERDRFTEWHHGKYSASLKIMEWLHGDITKRNVRMMRSDTNSWQLRLTKKCLGYMFHEITFFKIFYFCN